ncbi:hypothetical protein JCM21714_4721 [Gracilibacillus boraciitolerans JCM 21714]|uniref:Membrane-bound metal-dependent hydrolase YdjM n=1 Tax=Gracilibacillus boraciitolerans JCM 21714 TaxID=1298598 RepID=W4VQ50_9BACI|nr:metal-dependent hydrolase [Gracilibacillus boraciitolerans]GAE95475.1 hypothetical protein JCM21714_4721 [Gracilibacillus boraciitolerans JCM 21714]
MTGKTHLIGGIAATTVITSFTNYDPIIFIAAGAVGGLIPDICHGGSKIGRKFPLLSNIINKIFGHRTFTHSLLFLIVMGGILSMITSNSTLIAGLIIGMSSHLLLDAATKRGIKLLYPVNLTVRFPVTIKTGGTIESIVLLLLALITIYYGKDIVISSLNS